MERPDGIVVTTLDEMRAVDSPHALYHVVYKGDAVFSTTIHQELRSGTRSDGHRHSQPELFIVIGGTLIIKTEVDEIRASAGTSILIPSDVPHAVRNPDDKEPTISILLMGEGYRREDNIPVNLWN